MSPGLPQLVMRRPRLDDLPDAVPPPGYAVRCFEEGDQAGWSEAMERAFEWEPGQADFEVMMRSDSAYAPERVKMVVAASGQVAATASCWPAPAHGDHCRTLHWVATHPDHGGRRLGCLVSLAALHHAAAEGCRAMALLTDDYRDGALKTYLRMGFVPVLTHRSHADRWRLILKRLAWPDVLEVLEG